MEHAINKYINVNGKLLDLSSPKVMGILNLTPDSFYAESRKQTEQDIRIRTRQIIEEGGSIIDVGAYSSRSKAEHITPDEEMRRLRNGLQIINSEYPDAIISVDTFRADVARMCVEEYGVAIINDIADRRNGRKHVSNDSTAKSTLHHDAHAGYSAKYATESSL